MVTINNIKVTCHIGDAGVGGQIASLTQKYLNQLYRGKDYNLVANTLETATYDSVRRIRTHLQVGVTIRLEQTDGVVHISIHPPFVAKEDKLSDVGGEVQEEQTDPILMEVLEEEELPHHKKYWPIQSKNDPVPRWGRTPSGRRRGRRGMR